jgi:MFS family permease
MCALPRLPNHARPGDEFAAQGRSKKVMASRTLADTSPIPTRRWLALTLLCLALFMDVLGSTSVFAAAPAIARALGLSTGEAQWVFTAYALSFGGLLLLGGRAADVVGRRRLFMIGVAVFVAASLLCGLAWTGGVLIVARAVQGASAAFMAPAALSLVVSTFEDGRELNKALGIWSALGGIGATAGLLVGGAITSGWGWEFVFFINVPVGLAMLALSPVLLRESRKQARRPRLNLAGAVTITVALILFVYAVTQAPRAGWASPQTIGLVAAAAALTAVFGLVESKAPAPMVPRRLLRARSVVGGNLVLLATGMSVDGMLFIFTLYSQQIAGYTALGFGLLMAVMTATSTAAAYGAQRVVTRTGYMPAGVAGMALMGVSCLSLVRISVQGLSVVELLLDLVLFGVGIGSAFVAASIASLADVDEKDSGVAAGLQSSSFNIGNALGVALVSTVVAAVATSNVPSVLTQGYRAGLVATAVVAAAGIAAALITHRRTLAAS